MNTLFDKIWDKHVVQIVPDGPTQLYIDRLYCHEVTSPQAFAGMRARGLKMFRPDQIFCMPDHNTRFAGLQRQHLFVDFALGVGGALRGGLGGSRGAVALPGQLQRPLCGLFQRQALFGLGSRRSGHDQNVFAARLVPGVVGLCLAEGGLPDLLMQLGQFPAEGDAPLGAKSRREVVQRGAQLVGRFVEDDRPLLALQLGQPLPLLLFVHGQEPLEHPAGGILAGDCQRRDAGRCGRHRHHPDAPRQRIPHDDLAGVGDAGHPGV